LTSGDTSPFLRILGSTSLVQRARFNTRTNHGRKTDIRSYPHVRNSHLVFMNLFRGLGSAQDLSNFHEINEQLLRCDRRDSEMLNDSYR
jgi:hypothetical protein